MHYDVWCEHYDVSQLVWWTFHGSVVGDFYCCAIRLVDWNHMGMIFYWSDIGSHSVGKVIIQSVSCVSGPMHLHFVSLLLHRAGLMICGFQISVHSTEVCLQGTVSLLFLHIYGDADYDHFHICVDCISVWYWEVMQHVFQRLSFSSSGTVLGKAMGTIAWWYYCPLWSVQASTQKWSWFSETVVVAW